MTPRSTDNTLSTESIQKYQSFISYPISVLFLWDKDKSVLWPIAAAMSFGLFVCVCLVTSFTYKNIFLIAHRGSRPYRSGPTSSVQKQETHFTQSWKKKLPKMHLSWLEKNVCLIRDCLKEGKKVLKLCKYWLFQSCHPHTYCLHLYLLSTEVVYMILRPLKSRFTFYPDTFFSLNHKVHYFALFLWICPGYTCFRP